MTSFLKVCGTEILDEFPEFDRRVIEALRQPLEDKMLSVARAKGSGIFPADVMLVAAMNPCPCGNWGNSKQACVCTPQSLVRYGRKLSGPIVDRIDMWIEVGAITHEALSKLPVGEASASIRQRVVTARERQQKRFQKTILRKNSDMGVKDIDAFVPLTDDVRALLNASAMKLHLSARAYHRVIKLARTIADLSESTELKTEHMLEALHYRPKAFVT